MTDEKNNIAEEQAPESVKTDAQDEAVPADKNVDESYEHSEKKDKKVKIHISELEALKSKAQKLDELQDTFVRRVADFENAKKRLVREKEEFAKFASERIIAAFLPVLDNLDRALQHAGNSDTVEGILSGVKLIKKQINDILDGQGLTRIESVGKEFNPHFHEAMGTVDSSEYPDDYVCEEIQPGYMLKDKLLRPAWVRVVKNADGEEDGEKSKDNECDGSLSSDDEPNTGEE